MARLDYRPPRRVELLLQAARTKDHARRVGNLRFHGHRLHHRSSIKSVNPVALPSGVHLDVLNYQIEVREALQLRAELALVSNRRQRQAC